MTQCRPPGFVDTPAVRPLYSLPEVHARVSIVHRACPVLISSVEVMRGLHRSAHQRPDPLSPGAPGGGRRRADRGDRHPGGAPPGPRSGPRSRRGGSAGRPAGLPDHGLRQVQVRARRPPEGSPQEAVAERPQGDQVPAEDRPARLRHEEGPRRAVPQGRQQGQGHDHVPRARDGAHASSVARSSTVSSATWARRSSWSPCPSRKGAT